jgi:15-cis-phytoene synthase/lycopene beta-cyclase
MLAVSALARVFTQDYPHTYLGFHFHYTIPPALLLLFITRPWLQRIDILSLKFLLTVCYLYTTPWDSFIIHQGAWTYPEGVVISTFLRIPVEELLFFGIQTLILVLICTITLGYWGNPFTPLYYAALSAKKSYFSHYAPIFVSTVCGIAAFLNCVYRFNESLFYLSCIVWWFAIPFNILWYLAGTYFIHHNPMRILATIIVPGLYLSYVDSIAINLKLWHIEHQYSTRIVVFNNLPIEEFIFFIATTILVVLGYLCCIRSFAIYHLVKWTMCKNLRKEDYVRTPYSVYKTFPFIDPEIASCLLSDSDLDLDILEDLSIAEELIKKGSKSFYFASKIYPSPIREEIYMFYAFCRVTDDLIDDCDDERQQRENWDTIDAFLNDCIVKRKQIVKEELLKKLDGNYEAFSAFRCLHRLSDRIDADAVYDLLKAYKFDSNISIVKSWEDFFEYCSDVAGSVGRVCTSIFATSVETDIKKDPLLLQRANDLGIGFQIINIARDILNDASKLKRVYLPDSAFFGDSTAAIPLSITNRFSSLEKIKFPKIPCTRRSYLNDPFKHYEQSHEVSKSLVELSRPFYESAAKGILSFPVPIRCAVLLGMKLYFEIGVYLVNYKRKDPESDVKALWRMYVPFQRKLLILLQVLFEIYRS